MNELGNWFKADVDGWALVAELAAGRGVWTEEAAASDLRWHWDQRAKVELPGAAALGKRWGWTRYAAEKFLSRPHLWWDPKRGTPPKERSDWLAVRRLQPTSAKEQPTSADIAPTSADAGRVNADNESGFSRLQPTSAEISQGSAEPCYARASMEIRQDQDETQRQTQEQGVSDPSASDGPRIPGAAREWARKIIADGPCQVCGHIIAAGCQHGITGPLGADPGLQVTEGLLFHHRPPEAVQTPPATTDIAPPHRKASKAPGAPAKGIADPGVAKVWEAYRAHHPQTKTIAGRDIAGAIEDYGVEAVLLMVEWVHLDPGEDAEYLRRKGYHVNDTLWRKKTRGRYVYLAQQWHDRGRTEAPPARPQNARDAAAADALEWARNTLAPQRDVIDVDYNTEEQGWIR